MILYDINREASKISALSSVKLHKYEYLTGEDILPSAQQQIIDQTKFTYSHLGKAFDKQIKIIEDQGKKQVDGLNTLKSDYKITIKKYMYIYIYMILKILHLSLDKKQYLINL